MVVGSHQGNEFDDEHVTNESRVSIYDYICSKEYSAGKKARELRIFGQKERERKPIPSLFTILMFPRMLHFLDMAADELVYHERHGLVYCVQQGHRKAGGEIFILVLEPHA